MRRTFVEITTHDTKKTYRFPPKEGVKNPQIWEVKLQIRGIGAGGQNFSSFMDENTVFLERKTLEEAGLMPKTIAKKGEATAQIRTAEDLIIELLEMVGYYPTE